MIASPALPHPMPDAKPICFVCGGAQQSHDASVLIRLTSTIFQCSNCIDWAHEAKHRLLNPTGPRAADPKTLFRGRT